MTSLGQLGLDRGWLRRQATRGRVIPCHLIIIAASAAGLIALHGVEQASAQVALDGSANPAFRGALPGPDFDIRADLGRRAGRNLFHSFERFSLATGEIATFSGPDAIRNVISRVTGGERSDIDGTIRSTIPGADLYFINPAGVVFGPEAQLDVQGSFHVSTANEIRFADGATFNANNPTASSLTVAAPETFGFVGAAPAAITVDRSQLGVDAGESLSVVGGSVKLKGAQLAAPSGRIKIASIASAGQVDLSGDDLDPQGVAAFGPIKLVEGASISARGDPGGQVLIRSDRLIIDNAGFGGTNIALNAGTVGDLDGAEVGIDLHIANDIILNKAELVSSSFGAGHAGDIRITADRLLMIGDPTLGDPNGLGSNIASRVFGSGNGGQIDMMVETLDLESNALISTQVTRSGSGNAGDILIRANSIDIDGSERSTFVDSSTFGSGNAGNIQLIANNIILFGDASNFTGLASQVGLDATGNAGSITIQTEDLKLRNGSQINVSTFGTGDAGSVTVAADRVLLSGDEGFSVILSTAEAGSSGDAGAVTVAAEDVELRGGGIIISDTFAEGDAGAVTIQAGQMLISDDNGSKGFTGLGSRARGGSTGAGGLVMVKARELEVRGGSTISSGTFAEGDAGTVAVEAGRLLIVGDGSERFAGIRSQADRGATGAGGVVTVTADELDLRRRGAISSGTFGEEDGGAVTVTAGQLRIVGDGSGFFTGITSSNQPGARGNAGSVTVTADELEIQSGGITSDTFGEGDAGRVAVDAGRLQIIGNDSGFLTAIATAAAPESTGAAGSVTVNAATIILADRGSIASSSSGTGRGGRVVVRAGNTLRSMGGRVTAQTLEGDAGDVTIRAGQLIDLIDSTVTTSAAAGQGGGGNVLIEAPFVILDDSRVGTRALQGAGGRIDIVADAFIASPDSILDASSKLGINGRIEIRAPDEEISRDLTVPENALLDASSLLREPCTTRGDIGASSFTGIGRGGLPPGPDGPLASAYTSWRRESALNIEVERNNEQHQPLVRWALASRVPCRGAL